MKIKVEKIATKFGVIQEYIISNSRGITIKLLNLGATIKEIHTPDREGNIENIVLTYEKNEDYFENTAYLGSIIGPIAGRVAGAVLNIDSKLYSLESNDGFNSLHSGKEGLSHKKWESFVLKNEDQIKVIFYIKKLCGEGGHPGNIDIKIEYSLDEDNLFKMRYEAVSDKDTVLNLTNHVYFNLSGNVKRKVNSHSLKIPSETIYENNVENIITDNLIPVKNTGYDFSEIAAIKEYMKYNEYYPFNHQNSCILLYEEESGRMVSIKTNHKGMVLYASSSPNFKKLSSGKKYENWDGVALEFQNKPIGENNLFLEESLLKAKEIYSRECSFKFENVIKCRTGG